MNTKEYLQKHGARRLARYFVNARIGSITGLSIDDLPDSSEVCDIVDRLEEVLENVEDGDELPKTEIKSILGEIDLEFIQELVFS